MEPEIHYVRSADGTSIAYATIGSGPPLIVLPPSITFAIEREWQIPNNRARIELSVRVFTYVGYDLRGAGLSDRDAHDFSLNALVADLDAVADAVSPDAQVAIFAPGMQGPVGIAYAATRPDRVSKLVLWATSATGQEMDAAPLRRIRELAEIDWALATDAQAQAVDSFEDPALARAFSEMMRVAVEPQTYLEFERQRLAWDVRPLLGQVRAPTLLMHPKAHKYYPLANAQRLAVGIAGSTLRLIDTGSVLLGDRTVALAAGQFLLAGRSDMPAATRPQRSPQPHGMLVILFADIVDSTGMTERIGDTAFRERSGALERRLRAAIEREGGRTVEGRTLGDGVLASFRSAKEAIAAARRCASAAEAEGLRLHLGLHAGDVIREANNVYGGAVNIASRISALSAPGEVLVSRTVADLARTSAGVSFEDRGEQHLKGVADPVRVFAVKM
jgi:class 3 adenylate cyclase